MKTDNSERTDQKKLMQGSQKDRLPYEKDERMVNNKFYFIRR